MTTATQDPGQAALDHEDAVATQRAARQLRQRLADAEAHEATTKARARKARKEHRYADAHLTAIYGQGDEQAETWMRGLLLAVKRLDAAREADLAARQEWVRAVFARRKAHDELRVRAKKVFERYPLFDDAGAWTGAGVETPAGEPVRERPAPGYGYNDDTPVGYAAELPATNPETPAAASKKGRRKKAKVNEANIPPVEPKPASKLFPDPPPEPPEPAPAPPADAEASWRKLSVEELDPPAHIRDTLALREIATVGELAYRLDTGKRIVGLSAEEVRWLRERVDQAKETVNS